MSGSSVKDIIRCVPKNQSHINDFCDSEGSILIELHSGDIIAFYNQDELNSITLWLEKSEKGEVNENDYFLYDEDFLILRATETQESIVKEILNQVIISLDVIYQHKHRNHKYDELPNEVGLIIGFQNMKFLSLSHYVFSKSNDFEVCILNKYPMLNHDIYSVGSKTS